MSEDTYYSLLKKFELTKRELGDAESSIRRITGRNPDEIINGVPGGKYRQNSFSANERKTFYPGKDKRKRVEPTKQEPVLPEHVSDGESSPDENPVKKPSLASTVVAKSNQAKSRKATIAEQNVNSKLRARNHRIFQALIGTLERFQTEEKKRQHVVSMRAEIEKKVEATTEEQREEIKKEKKTLFATRKLKLVELRCLEKKIERAESYEVFEKVHKHMINFIKTKAKPHVFFLPAKHTPETRQRYEESKLHLQDLLHKKNAELEADLAAIEESYIKDPMSSTVSNDGQLDLPMDEPMDENNHPKLVDSAVMPSDATEGNIEIVELDDENDQDEGFLDQRNDSKLSHANDENESIETIELDSEPSAVDHDDTGPDDDESFERNLADSLSDQEFVPIYD